MNFKKDYINYVLHSVLNGTHDFRTNERLKALVKRIIATDDMVKITYLVGKTAGLDLLFKYLLYISDKIDKSQITVFNLKDNYDYDMQNLVRVFEKLMQFKSESAAKKISAIEIPDETAKEEVTEKTVSKDRILIDVTKEEEAPKSTEEIFETEEEFSEADDNSPALTLIENTGTGITEAEVFELSEISDELDTTVKETEDEDEPGAVSQNEEIPVDTEEETDDIIGEEETIKAGNDSANEEMFELDSLEDEAETLSSVTAGQDKVPELPIEIEVRKPLRDYDEPEEVVKEESVTNEAYYKFESKFFEEVKILEKLFSSVEKESKSGEDNKLSERCLQSISEIIEITSELSNLSRQLSFDLIADIFLTMNLYFTKTINSPSLISGERIRLLDSSLALVNSLIKGEDYLNYDVIVDKIEDLKSEMQRPVEAAAPKRTQEVKDNIAEEPEAHIVKAPNEQYEESAAGTVMQEEAFEEQELMQTQQKSKHPDLESVNFKMRYLIKEFEKSFKSIGSIKGEYKRFDALDKIDELNNALRLIAKISAAVKMKDVLKLSEVTYVFLKYLKDYRMDMMESEIQQIIKYVIFTFKMLLTDRKPEDFNVLVQYLNNPVKIFSD